MSDSTGAASDPAVTAGGGGAGRPPFVGRQRELSVLLDRLDAATHGRGGVVLIAGDPGIGKSRLLDEVAARAVAAPVLRGGASDAEGMPPYLPFLEALGRHVRMVAPEDLRRQAGPHAATLAGLLPELAARLGDLPPGYTLPPEQARLRLFEAIGEFLLAIATNPTPDPSPTRGGEMAKAAPLDHPGASPPFPAREGEPGGLGMLLILDDLQWADAASLDLLCHIARTVLLQPPSSNPQPLILGAYREGELERNPALERALAELVRLRLLTTVTAGPLAEAEMDALAAGALDARLEPAAARLLHRQSEGNPFFAEELLRGWVESGALVQEGGRWHLVATTGATPEGALPSSIVGAVRRRLARLPVEVVDLLRTAAIVGRTFDSSLLAGVIGDGVEEVEEALSTAVRARLLRMDRDGVFAFSHDKVRECLYAEVTAARRTRLHGAIGRALEERPSTGIKGAPHACPGVPGTSENAADAMRLADLAFHFARSGDRARGAEYSRLAARAALDAYAAEEALARFHMALDLLEPGDDRHGELQHGLGDAALLAGREREAAASYDAARAWFLERSETVAAARAAHAGGRAWWRIEEHQPARTAFEAALALLEGAGPPGPATVRVLADLAELLAVSMGLLDEGVARARQALDLAQDLDDPHLLAVTNRVAGNLLVRIGDLAEGIGLLERALELAERADDPAEAAECCGALTLAYIWSGHVRAAMDAVLRRREFAHRCHDPYQLRHVSAMLAGALAFTGRIAEAEAGLAAARQEVERLESPEPRAFLTLQIGWIAQLRGDDETATALMREAMAVFRAMGPGALVWYLGQEALLHAEAGRRDEALARLDELEGLIALHPPRSMPAGEANAYFAQTALVLGDRARALRCYPRLRPLAGQFHDLSIDRLLGAIETLQGEYAAAEAHLAATEEAARREDVPVELARTLSDQATLALARGGKDAGARARVLLERAVGIMDSLGLSGEAARARARLAALPGGGEPSRAPLPAGLSEREAEVLRLVATGLSNRRIAERLYLSEKTIANHLTSIFTKTGADNRAAATAFAIRHGLA